MPTKKGVICLLQDKGCQKRAKWVAKEATIRSSWRPSLRGISSAAWKPSWLLDINKHSIESFMISVKNESTYLQMLPSLPCQWTSLSFRLLEGLDEETHHWHLAEPIEHLSVDSNEDGSHLIIETNAGLGICCCQPQDTCIDHHLPWNAKTNK